MKILREWEIGLLLLDILCRSTFYSDMKGSPIAASCEGCLDERDACKIYFFMRSRIYHHDYTGNYALQ